MADGVEPADVYKVLRTPQGVDRAFRKLDEIKPYTVWWSSISQVPDLLASGEVAMSMTSPGRLLVANREEGRQFKVVWDGNIYSVDYWVILKGSPRREQAMQLLRYMKEPEHEVRLAQLHSRPDCRIAQPSPRWSRSSSATRPRIRRTWSSAVELDAQFWVEHLEELTQRFNAWAAQ